MGNKRMNAMLGSLLFLLMVVNPVFSATAVCETGAPASIGSEESLIVQIYEEETVISNYSDTNYHGNVYKGGLFIGFYPVEGFARAWLKYDLSAIPKEIGILNAELVLYCNDDYFDTDFPIGVYYSDNDTWSEITITWETQPSFNFVPIDIISSPASPDMFVDSDWYAWDVTGALTRALSDDKMLTLLMKLVDEIGPTVTWKYFVEDEFDAFYASYISIEYFTPETASLTVDGQSTAPLIDYIQDSTPDLGWTMADSGTGEFQRDYALEVNSNEYFNGTPLWSENHTTMVTIYDSSGSSNLCPFGTAYEFRYQMKYGESLISESGVVDRLHFETIDETGTIVFENLVVLLVCTPTAGDLTTDFQANYGGAEPTVVLNRSSLNAAIKDYHFSIDVENTFYLNARQHLIIELRFTNNTGTLALTPITNGVGGSVAYTYGIGAYTSTSAGTIDNRANSLTVELTSDEAHSVAGTILNNYPFNTDNGNPGMIQLKYNKTLIDETGIIDRIFFPGGQLSGDVVYEGFEVRLVESPRLGTLNHTNFAENYGGVAPTIVLDEDLYQIRNLGGVLVIDVNNAFYYRGEHDLLVELKWANKISGSCTVYRTVNTGAYRAYNVTSGVTQNNNDNVAYDMVLDFVHSENPIEYAGTPLLNATTYYWRVKTCDSTGIWSDWTSSSFKYEKLTSTPAFEGPIASPSPAYVGSPVTVSLEVTYFLGISEVWIELSGTNHSMVAMVDIYSYTWTPDSAGNVTYTIYMESNIGTWSSVDGFLVVLQPGLVIDPIMLLAIAGVVLVVVIVLVVVLRGRGKK